MKNTHEKEKEQFVRLFKAQGLERFNERFQVLEAFLKLDHHVSEQEIVDQLEKDGIGLSLGFVRTSMEHLCRFGFAVKLDFDQEGPALYEHHHIGIHHDHMICTKCGNILEFRDEILEKQQRVVAETYGFHMLQHRMEIYGICGNCMSKRRGLVPLHKAKTGERVIVKSLEAGKKMQLRIASLGLRVGDQIEVVSNGFGGQVVIAVGENRLVIGNGMAQKIWVDTVEEKKNPVMASEIKDESRGIVLKLSQMKSGQEGFIAKVSGSSLLRRRLMEMGINRGAKIRVEKYAPLRDPLELVVKGYHISLRVEEASHIEVENVRDLRR